MFRMFSAAKADGPITDAPRLADIFMNALQFLLSAVGILAIIMLIISGTIYFFSAGDKRKMEVAKRSTVYAIIGIITAFSAMIVVRLIGSFFST